MKKYLITPQLDAPSKLEIHETEKPSPAAGEVLVKIHAASINYRDLLILSGQSASGGSDPVIPLSDGAGEITALGENVTEWQIGDRVCPTFFRDWQDGRFNMSYHKAARGGSCDGVLAEFITAPADSLVRIPEHLDYAEAATLPCAGLTAWHSLMENAHPVREGDTVLCLGTGGVSIFALQIAKAAGARVLITSSSDEKLARAIELGADDTINYARNSDWEKIVYKKTDRQGVDHVIEVGGPGTLEKSLASVAPGGTISQIGVLTGFDPPQTSLFPLVTKNARIHGIYVGSRDMFKNFNRFLKKHQIKPVIDQAIPFDQAPEAYETMKNATHFGKIVITL